MSGRVSVIAGGAYRTCPVCGRRWFVCDLDQWVFFRWKGAGQRDYFCSWKCIREWDKDHPMKREYVHSTRNRRGMA